jgi:hypothetical protein
MKNSEKMHCQKTLQFFKNLFNVVMLDPLATFKASMDVSVAIGMADTVHLKDEGYKVVAQRFKAVDQGLAAELNEEGGGHGGCEQRGEETQDGQPVIGRLWQRRQPGRRLWLEE